MEVEMEKRNNDESQDIVDSSDNEHLKLSFLEEKKTGYKINRKSEKNVSKDEADMKKVRLWYDCKTQNKEFVIFDADWTKALWFFVCCWSL